MRKLLPFFLISCLAFLSLASAPPSGNTDKNTVAVIQGYVYDAYSGLGLEGVVVSAIDHSATSLSDGSFELILAAGNYDLYFTKIGWITGIIPGLPVSDTLVVEMTLQRQPHGFPFVEDWSSGSFETNFWTFEPEQGKWQISDTLGNPPPAAIFKGDSATLEYSFALVSHTVNLTNVFQNIALYFDVALVSYINSGQESLVIDIWNGDHWITIDTLNNEESIELTEQYYDITTIAAGKTIKVRFLAQGVDASEINYWLIDNIRITHPPAIVVSPSVFYGAFSASFPGSYFYPMTFNNDGLEPLKYSVTITRDNTKALEPFPASFKHAHDEMKFSRDPDPQPGGEPDSSSQVFYQILHYDGPNGDAIGLTAGGTFHVAARFPTSMVGPFANYVLESVDIYINTVPVNAILKIWGAGTGTSPGAILHQQVFTPTGMSWNNIVLSSGLVLQGTDIWVGYSVTHNAGQYPVGCDSGPANPNGDWLSMNGVSWEHLAGYGLNYNWNIRARLSNWPLWLDVQPRSGEIAGNSNETLDVIFLNYQLWPYFSETAYINIATNDPLNPLVIVPVHIDVHNSIENLNEDNWAICYPIPASEIIILEVKHEISGFRVIDQMGSTIITENASGKTIFNINVKHLPNGLYFLQANAKDGKVYSRKIVISR